MLSLMWGSSFILIKKGLAYLTPQEVAVTRITAALLFLLPFALSRLSRIKSVDWKNLAAVGAMGTFIPSFLFAIAQTELQSSLAGVLNALTPIFVILMGLFFFDQKYTRRTYLGVGMGFIGTALLILADESGGISFNVYGLLIVLATILYAGNLNLIKQFLGHLKALTITSISVVIVGPLALVYLLAFTDVPNKIFIGGEVTIAIGYIVLLGVMSTAIALIIFNHIVQLTNPVFTSSVTYLIPLVAIVWGLVDGETLSLIHFVGIAGIILGVYVANKRDSKIKSQRKEAVTN